MPEKIHLASTHSTNTYLRQLAEANLPLEEGTIVWADFQSKGRGQLNNTWESEKDKNLLFTLFLKPYQIHAADQFIISQIVSIGICNVLNRLQEGFQIKWPNDIYYKEKKVAGILIENDLSGHVLYHSFIGIGLNVNQAQFLSDAPNPISIYQIIGQEIDREALLDQIINEIMRLYATATTGEHDDIQEIYMNTLFRKEGYHRYREGQVEFEAQITEISPQGLLTLTCKQGKERQYNFKEVEFVL